MHKLAFILLGLTCLFFSACDKGPGVEIPFQAFVIIPAGLNTGLSHHFPVLNLPGIGDNLLDAQPARITLTVEYGEANLDFIDQAFLRTSHNSTFQEMAYHMDMPFAANSTVDLFPSILDMSDHITQDRFDMQLKLRFRSIPVTETRIRIDFSVQAIIEG